MPKLRATLPIRPWQGGMDGRTHDGVEDRQSWACGTSRQEFTGARGPALSERVTYRLSPPVAAWVAIHEALSRRGTPVTARLR